MTYLLSNRISNREVCSIEVDIVSDEWHTSTDSYDTGRGVDVSWTEVWVPLILVDLLSHTLELTLADLSEVLTMRSCSALFIEEDGYTDALADLLADLLRELDSFLHLHVADGDKGDNVDSAHTWVLTLVLSHVDHLDSDLDSGEDRLADSLRLAHNGNHATVVILVIAVV